MKAQDKSQRLPRPLSDGQWRKIERASGLPSEARSSIESCIRAYVTLQEGGSRVPPAQTRSKLRKLRSQAKALLKSFEEAVGHDDVYFALVRVRSNEWHPRNREQRKDLAEHHRTEKAKAHLKAFVDWLEQRERVLPPRKPGPSVERAENVYLFVDLFANELHHYTKKRLTRSDHHRKMMEEIFEFVDREVGKGTIDTAMRRVCAHRRSRHGLLPGSHFKIAEPDFPE